MILAYSKGESVPKVLLPSLAGLTGRWWGNLQTSAAPPTHCRTGWAVFALGNFDQLSPNHLGFSVEII